ncbi:DUF3311 domain-containing protein [Saccharothrix coeruleofusca]|uniref:DUF3311 domain-containing protein n=1 Tax=Saccharothrix coeruleofusca TaxID=33919 RepID=A0A918AI54_9PSEU|nr:DUF3311 domain-containing protein [Saccharothrix coeruleofusca]MBP2339849.1 hypothetical protein [Saccharothrix coeruleofusca]GGP39201.1 hypothetical protein GCM10010185_08420 [Saccharothrix coeruleofusca]
MRSARKSSLRWSNWNLLLLVPLLMLITPWFNADEPRVLGLPFFYWYQFAFVPVGVLCVGLVYVKTKDRPAAVHGKPDRLGVDDLDEGAN